MTQSQHGIDLSTLSTALGAGRDNERLVELSIDGAHFVAELCVDGDEERRRLGLGLGAVTSTGLLHALWEAPTVPMRRSELGEMDLGTLDSAPRGVVRNIGRTGISRVYAPIGEVRSLAVVDVSLAAGIRRASTVPPILERICVWLPARGLPILGTAHKVLAQYHGVGVVRVVNGNAEALLEPRAAIQGIPTVYRWWLAELAYRSLCHQAHTAHAVS